MLFLIELLLTIAAWRKGWGAKALIPIGVGIAVAVFFGVIIGASGQPVKTVAPLFILGDLICIAVLARLAVRGPETSESQSLSLVETPAEPANERERAPIRADA